MFRAFHLRKAHARFLESCRNLKEGRAYWDQAGGLTRWFLQALTPIPLLGLHEDGRLLLEALQWLEAHCRERPLREPEIRRYHQTLCGKNKAEAGQYRKHPLAVSSVPRPAPEKIQAMMKQLDLKLAQEQEKLDAMKAPDPADVLKMAAETHRRIGHIHPFADGNGRVARLSMNHLLRRYNLGYILYPPLSESPALWKALQDADRGNLEPLLDFARTCLYRVE